jgi:hypothetical protein
LSQISKNYNTFSPKKLSLSSQKYEFGIRDPGKPIPDLGSRILKGRNTDFNNGIQYYAKNTGKYILPQNVGSSCWRSSLGSSWDRRHPLSTGEPTAAKNSEFYMINVGILPLPLPVCSEYSGSVCDHTEYPRTLI